MKQITVTLNEAAVEALRKFQAKGASRLKLGQQIHVRFPVKEHAQICRLAKKLKCNPGEIVRACVSMTAETYFGSDWRSISVNE
jgi:hypothetical protein